MTHKCTASPGNEGDDNGQQCSIPNHSVGKNHESAPQDIVNFGKVLNCYASLIPSLVLNGSDMDFS